MKLKTMLTVATAALALTTGVAIADTVKIGIAAEPYPPFTIPDSSGNWTGWEVEIAQAICAAESLECAITPVSWDGIIPSLLGKQIDVIIASMSITEEREKKIAFSDKYYNNIAVIVAPTASDITPDAQGLKGRVLGVQASTIHQAYVQKHFEDIVSEIRVYQTQDEANQDLYSGRIDALQADNIAMDAFVKSDNGACCEIKGEVPIDEAVLGKGAGAGVRKEDTELLAKLNDGIDKILADGTHQKITAKYFSVPIYSE